VPVTISLASSEVPTFNVVEISQIRSVPLAEAASTLTLPVAIAPIRNVSAPRTANQFKRAMSGLER